MDKQRKSKIKRNGGFVLSFIRTRIILCILLMLWENLCGPGFQDFFSVNIFSEFMIITLWNEISQIPNTNRSPLTVVNFWPLCGNSLTAHTSAVYELILTSCCPEQYCIITIQAIYLFLSEILMINIIF